MEDKEDDAVETWYITGNKHRLAPLLRYAAKKTAAIPADADIPIEHPNGLLESLALERDATSRQILESGDFPDDMPSSQDIATEGHYSRLLQAVVALTPEAAAGQLLAQESFRVCIYEKKILADRKKTKVRALEARKFRPTNVSLTDPDILPRHMRGSEFVNLYNAVSFANAQGYMMNTHLTINWRDLGLELPGAAESHLQKGFIHHLRSWCQYHKVKLFWIYSHESSRLAGMHTHFLTSMDEPLRKPFREFVEMRMRKINKAEKFLDTAFDINMPKNPRMSQQWRLFHYLCKGVDPKAKLVHVNGIDKVRVSDLIEFAYESPGEVTFRKRCGYSDNLGPNSRQTSGFISNLDKRLLNIHVLYPDALPPPRERTEEEIIASLQNLNI